MLLKQSLITETSWAIGRRPRPRRSGTITCAGGTGGGAAAAPEARAGGAAEDSKVKQTDSLWKRCQGGNPKANSLLPAAPVLICSNSPPGGLSWLLFVSLLNGVFCFRCVEHWAEECNSFWPALFLGEVLLSFVFLAQVCPSHMDIKESNSSLSVDTEKSSKTCITYLAVHITSSCIWFSWDRITL